MIRTRPRYPDSRNDEARRKVGAKGGLVWINRCPEGRDRYVVCEYAIGRSTGQVAIRARISARAEAAIREAA